MWKDNFNSTMTNTIPTVNFSSVMSWLFALAARIWTSNRKGDHAKNVGCPFFLIMALAGEASGPLNRLKPRQQGSRWRIPEISHDPAVI